jgi:hypothetical protein
MKPGNIHISFLHTADIHLGKTYRTSAGDAERYEDFFRMSLLQKS